MSASASPLQVECLLAQLALSGMYHQLMVMARPSAPAFLSEMRVLIAQQLLWILCALLALEPY